MKTYGLKIISPYEDLQIKKIDILKDETHSLDNHTHAISFYVKNGAQLNIIENANDNKKEINVYLVSENAKVNIKSKLNVKENNILDSGHFVYHQANNTISNISTIGLVNNNAKIILRENIISDKGLTNIYGIQSAKIILLNNTAKVEAIPSINIFSNDIICEHSLSISDISKNLLWYGELRGINKDEVKKLYNYE
jgi:Fe-S cluster assembly scaffold protein SufB